MKISLDWVGCYLEHKEYFDEMVNGLQRQGHLVGIITGEREAKRPVIERSLGFKADFIHLWGDYETIANGNTWKVGKLMEHGIAVHYDDDATEMKKYTDLWIIKTMNNAERVKF